MPSAKKFGAFAGVFTPSILTILGVIMYMRLGWVVGQAGLVTAVIIILLAHVISVTTGLSISSIATDKKIRTGGIYYILSRSLGLPMGGSIGITMFVGTALSISLYIIGFSENFLGIEFIREITGLGTTLNDFRILGTAVLVILVIIAYISTSIAIKTQFFILGAIALSIASVVLGFFTGSTSGSEANLLPVVGGVPVTTVFAIFFPAVTGFTAGVAMSGDLKNPQKNIPWGTMTAIVTGLLIYLGLAIGFGLLVDREILISDNNFLMKIAWSSPLVVAGIWGATLSSALGGILGGPRILQAMSQDRITPVFFGKGYGINNEPRNALMFTFLIAEGGVLIGDLDVVAAIVTMFYIAAYGFINLAFALEKWASADFRPTFRISKWVGIIGFATCFGVMFKLDTPVMFIAMIILAGIYMYIKKKKLALDFGDVWQSVWSSIARTILHRIDRKGLEERNWRPNIIMFSGGTHNRPHLMQFGKDLAGRQGFLSNFDLILNQSAGVLFKKHQQSVEDEFTRGNEGIFMRRHECKDIYEGIEAISSTYGFSGVEPNTILFGWARQSQDPVRFARMIRTLGDLDLNILMMDYDKDAGFGKREIIDVWCRGGGNNCSLVLALIKFMWMSENWKNARIRILIINPYNDEKETLREDMEKALEHARMDAEIKIINNQIERRPVNELIEVESSNSDIVFLGIPDIREGDEQDYVNQVNRLCQNVGTVILVKASSYFKNIEIGRSGEMVRQDKKDYSDEDIDLVINRALKIPEINYPPGPSAESLLKDVYEAVRQMNEEAFNKYLADLFSLNRPVYAEIIGSSNEALEYLKKETAEIIKAAEWSSTLSKTYRDIFAKNLAIVERQPATFKEQMLILESLASHFTEHCRKIIINSPEILIKTLTRDELRIQKGDRWKIVVYKLRKQLLFGTFKGSRIQKVKFRRLVASHFEKMIFGELAEVLQNWGLISVQQAIKTQDASNRVFDGYFVLKKTAAGHEALARIDEIMENNRRFREQIDKLNELSLQTFYTLLMNKTIYMVGQLGRELSEANSNAQIRINEKQAGEKPEDSGFFKLIPGKWNHNQMLLNNYSRLELMLFLFIIQGMDILSQYSNALGRLIDRSFTGHLGRIEAACQHSTQILYDTLADVRVLIDTEGFSGSWASIDKETTEKLNALGRAFIEKIELMDRAVFDTFKTSQFEGHRAVTLRSRKLVVHILQQDFITPILNAAKESREWFLREAIHLEKTIGESLDVLALVKNERIGCHDLPQIKKYLDAFSTHNLNAGRNKTRMLNQVRERANALTDKFSLHSITRRAGFVKKFMR